MKYIPLVADWMNFSGKKFLGFSESGVENPSSSADGSSNEGGSEAVDEAQNETKDRVEALLNEAEKIEQKIKEQQSKGSDSNPQSESADDSDPSGDSVLSDHNQEREKGNVDEVSASGGGEDDGGAFAAYKSQEKYNENAYQKYHKHLEDYLHQVNDLKKQNQIWGSAEKNLSRFRTESRVINELRFRSLGIFEDTKERITDFAEQFDAFKNRFLELEQEPNDILREEKRGILVREFVDHISSWKKSQGKIPGISQSIQKTKDRFRVLIGEIIPDKRSAENFLEKYFEEMGLAENALVKTLDTFLEALQSRNFSLSGAEAFWASLPKAIVKMNRYVDFNDGVLKEDGVMAEEQVKSQQKGLDFLKENGFFEEGEYGFLQKVKGNQSEMKSQVEQYDKLFQKVRKTIYKDIEKLSDNDFFDKYSADKEFLVQRLEAHAQQIEDFQEALNDVGHEDFLDYWLEKYEDSDESRAESLIELGELANYFEGGKNLETINAEFDQFLDTTQLVQTYRFSLYDMYQMFTRYFEKRERLWKRRSERAVANLGVDVFGADTPVGKEFVKESESEEAARVGEFEEQKGSLYGWDVQKDLYKTNDPDEAKACINLLINNGFMKWDDPEFWKTLNRLEGSNRFLPSDIERSTPIILNKVKEACTNIWSANDFNGWQTSLKSSAVSAQDAFSGEFEAYEVMDGGARTRILATMLQKWNADPRDYEGVDPAKFEAFIRFALEQGKMNGGPGSDQRWWFLVHGVASGLLSRDAFSRLNGEFLGGSPLIDFFTDSGWKKDGKPVSEGTPGAEARQWKYEDFQIWADVLGDADGMYDPGQAKNPEEFVRRREKFLYDYVYESTWAKDRVGRMVRNGAKNFDHDDAALYTAVFNVSDVRGLIGTESQGAEKLTKDFWRNYLAEFDNYFRNQYRKIQEGDRLFSQDDENWIQRRSFLLDDVAYRMRTAYGTVQTLLGNYNMSELARKRNTIFTKEDWEKDTPFSVEANHSKEQIFKMMNLMLSEADFDESQKSTFESFTQKSLVNEGEDDFKVADKFNAEIVKGELGDELINGNQEAVYRALQRYCQE